MSIGIEKDYSWPIFPSDKYQDVALTLKLITNVIKAVMGGENSTVKGMCEDLAYFSVILENFGNKEPIEEERIKAKIALDARVMGIKKALILGSIFTGAFKDFISGEPYNISNEAKRVFDEVIKNAAHLFAANLAQIPDSKETQLDPDTDTIKKGNFKNMIKRRISRQDDCEEKAAYMNNSRKEIGGAQKDALDIFGNRTISMMKLVFRREKQKIEKGLLIGQSS